MDNEILAGYAEDADYLIPAYETINSAELLRHVSSHLPETGSHIVDIGAGTGRDAAWLASIGMHVIAIEPVDAFRRAGQTLHSDVDINWVNDTLPAIQQVHLANTLFDTALLISVWQHIPSHDRKSSLSNIRSILKNDAKFIMSVRSGAGTLNRKCFPITAQETIELASQCGFKLTASYEANSIQQNNKQANVTWNWLVFTAT